MARKKTGSEAPGDETSFEHSLKLLQETVRDLESGGLSLTDSLTRYETGVKYLRQCMSLLERTEQRIRQLIQVDSDGNAVTVAFDHLASDAPSGSRPVRHRSRAAGSAILDEAGSDDGGNEDDDGRSG